MTRDVLSGNSLVPVNSCKVGVCYDVHIKHSLPGKTNSCVPEAWSRHCKESTLLEACKIPLVSSCDRAGYWTSTLIVQTKMCPYYIVFKTDIECMLWLAIVTVLLRQSSVTARWIKWMKSVSDKSIYVLSKVPKLRYSISASIKTAEIHFLGTCWRPHIWQLPIYASNRHGSTLTLIWSCVSGVLMKKKCNIHSPCSHVLVSTNSWETDSLAA